MKLKLITAALAIGFATGANAAIDVGTTNNGELFLNVFDATGSYTRDLGITISGFSALSSNQSFSADSTLSTWLGTHTSGVSWDVLAVGAQGTYQMVATYTPIGGLSNVFAGSNTKGNVTTTASGNSTNSSVTLAAQTLASNINTALDPTNNVALNLSGTFLSSDLGYSGNSGTFGALKFNTSTAFSSLGSTLDVLNMYMSNTSATTATTYSQYQYLNAGVAAPVQFTLDGSGNLGLTVASVAAVPEPETYGMLAAGLLMLGAVARRRGNRA